MTITILLLLLLEDKLLKCKYVQEFVICFSRVDLKTFTCWGVKLFVIVGWVGGCVLWFFWIMLD